MKMANAQCQAACEHRAYPRHVGGTLTWALSGATHGDTSTMELNGPICSR